MKVQILGPGCAKCLQLEANTRQALEQLGKSGPVEKITDVREIMKFGVMMTPALAVNGKVVFAGKVATPAEILSALTSVPPGQNPSNREEPGGRDEGFGRSRLDNDEPEATG